MASSEPSSSPAPKRRFNISKVQSRKVSMGAQVKFAGPELQGAQDNQQPPTNRPSPVLGKVGRLFTKRQSIGGVQLTHQKSLRHYLTREALPREGHYRNMASALAPGHRPTLEELRRDTREATMMDIQDTQDEEKGEGRASKFGWCAGVYIPCLLNIWGVMLFLRLTWVVGQAGILEGLAILVLSNVVTAVTTISMSAVSTNGLVKGGGIYFMISRSLGPEFGGSIGLMFTVANSVAVSMYIIGFCESLLDMIYQFSPEFDGIISSIRIHDVRLIGSVSLVGILALALVGMDWVTRVQKILLVLLIFSQLDFVIGTFLTPSPEEHAKGFVGWDMKVASTNLWSDYRVDAEGNTPSFFKVFSVFFPAVTGIVAGANLSGDLKDPSYSIPKGTFAAIGSTFVTYFVYFIMVGCVAVKFASGRVEELGFGEPGYNVTAYELNNVTRGFDDCLGRRCEYGTAVNQQMMEVMSAWGPLIYAGCFAATLSSAIASLVGAPRVLQALAKDRLYPYIEAFATGWGANNDPIRGYIFVFAISLVCILIGDLNVVSGLLSNFFVATYALINFSVFHASITKSPGWRPSFKYYNQWVSLFGTLLCVVVMFLMDHITALITFICIICLYICVSVRKPDANWGSSTQAQAFVTALKASQNLSRVSEHVKNYRPKVLLLCGPPAARPALVHFANLVTKRLSLLSTTDIVREEGMAWAAMEERRVAAQEWCDTNKVKAFHAVTRNRSLVGGVRAAIELRGLGKLAPNMLMLGFKEDWREEVEGAGEYLVALHTALDMHLSLGLLRVQGGFNVSRGDECGMRSSTSTPSLASDGTEVLVSPSSMATSVASMAMSVDSGLHISSTPDLRCSTPPTLHSTSQVQEGAE